MNKIEVEKYTDENGVLWHVKDLTLEQKEYHNEHMNKEIFKKYSPEMKIVANRIHTKDFGSDINKLDKSSVEYKKGIKYALAAIKDLNDNGIYHGDILSGHDTANPDIHDRNIVYNGKEYRLIDFGPKTQKATFEGEVDKKRANNKNIPKPTIQLKVGDPVGWEQTLLEAYNKAHGLRTQAQKPPEMRLKTRKVRPTKGKKRGFRGGPPNFSLSPKQPKKYEGSSPSSSGSDSPGSDSGLSDFDYWREEGGREEGKTEKVVKSLWGRGKKKRRRTKKKRRRKRKYTRRKKKRKRRRTKKKRRRRR